MIDDYEEYLLYKLTAEEEEPFTLESVYKKAKSLNSRISRFDVEDFFSANLNSYRQPDGTYTNSLMAFTNCWFSFKPTEEEVRKGCFIIGHRALPFLSKLQKCSRYVPCFQGRYLKTYKNTFSFNLVMDAMSYFGDNILFENLFSDPNNTEFLPSNMGQSMPAKLTLSCWQLQDISPERKFKYGDRVLCRVIDWVKCVIDLQPVYATTEDNVFAPEEFEREEWYATYEECFRENLIKNGPDSAISEQLLTLFLNYRDRLCVKNCGSSEEFLSHSKKICIKDYGLEKRFWMTDISFEECDSNRKYKNLKEFVDSIISKISWPSVATCVQNELYLEKMYKSKRNYKEFIQDTIPLWSITGRMNRITIYLVVRKLFKQYEKVFKKIEFKYAEARNRIVQLYQRRYAFLLSIRNENVSLEGLPQESLVIMKQMGEYFDSLLVQIDFHNIEDLTLSELHSGCEYFEFVLNEESSRLRQKVIRSFKNQFTFV